MQDFTGVPAIVDLAAMRCDAGNGGDTQKLIIGASRFNRHSVQVDEFGTRNAFQNVHLKWRAMVALPNFTLGTTRV
jgi:aconitate hydratase